MRPKTELVARAYFERRPVFVDATARRPSTGTLYVCAVNLSYSGTLYKREGDVSAMRLGVFRIRGNVIDGTESTACVAD